MHTEETSFDTGIAQSRYLLPATALLSRDISSELSSWRASTWRQKKEKAKANIFSSGQVKVVNVIIPQNISSTCQCRIQAHHTRAVSELPIKQKWTATMQSFNMSVYDFYNDSFFNNTNFSVVFNLSLEEEFGNDTSDVAPFVITVTTLEICLAVILAGFILAIIVGNVFVILSVFLFRDMRTLTNGLIVSLASADLLVAIIVLPISLHHEIIGTWTLGHVVCDFWITSDVFCCTASILNIVVIAVDRYWLITRNVRYTHNTTFSRQRVCIVMVFLAWSTSAIISSSPLFGWKQSEEKYDSSQCIISQDLGYTVFSTFGAFWFPLSIILIVYFKIFRIARTRASKRAKARAIHPSMNSTILSEGPQNGKASRYTRASDSTSPQTSPRNNRPPSTSSHKSSGSSRMRSRTRSSARTLGLIIGGFVLCWLPFFLVATILPFCSTCEVPPILMSIVLWLGYSNSLLNPAIYAIWDKNFRRSFKRLSTCNIRWSQVL